jgi:hypothetical protein
MPRKRATIRSVGTDTNRRAALVFGIAVPFLQTCRTVCFGHMPETWAVLPIELDAYVTGALLLAGAWASGRSAPGRALLAAGWGFATGIMYRTTFEQLADPSRHAGAQAMVLVFKAVLFVMAVAGFVGAILSAKAKVEAVSP